MLLEKLEGNNSKKPLAEIEVILRKKTEVITVEELQKLANFFEIDPSRLFSIPTFADKLSQLEFTFDFVRDYQKLAENEDIKDIFQDNGGKLLQVLLYTGLKNIASREGNDARDEHGNEFELKSLNAKLVKSFSTHHHLNPKIIQKYRKVDWIFAVYENIEIKEIYRLSRNKMEHYYRKWEIKYKEKGNKDLNNPKIPLSFVRSKGDMIFKSKC